jgi:hypothetical protein
MKHRAPILLSIATLSVLLTFSATNLSSVTKLPHARANSTAVVDPGNVADGMYTIVGEASHRCLEIASNSCAAVTPLQIFDCDKSGVSNNQKFNVVSDGSGNYTISPVHSDLCLEVSTDKVIDRTAVVQAECVAGKVSQKWSMNQFGVNLEIRDVGSNRCLDILRKGTDNFAPIFLRSCNDGPNQRWRLNKTTINLDQGVICRESPAHPARACSGVNDQQKEVSLGKTLTKARCDQACQATKMASCRWEEPK